MNLHIKRFTVRYQGNDYGPGSVIYDVEEDVGKHLIEGSNGQIERLPEKNTKAVADEKGGKGKGKNATQEEKMVEASGLPTVDPARTVK